MQISSIVKFDATFDYYIPVQAADGTISYTLSDLRHGKVIPGTGGITLLTHESMQIEGQVKNLRDRTGASVFLTDGVEYAMYVKSVAPVFNVFGVLEGWSHSLKRDASLLTNLQQQINTTLTNVNNKLTG